MDWGGGLASQAPGDTLGARHQSVSRGKGRGRTQGTRRPEQGAAKSLVHPAAPPSFISHRERGAPSSPLRSTVSSVVL